jgi:hypothetical protein
MHGAEGAENANAIEGQRGLAKTPPLVFELAHTGTSADVITVILKIPIITEVVAVIARGEG